MNELKPCPFCGSKANLIMKQKSKDFLLYVECSKCRARTNGYYPIVSDEKKAFDSLMDVKQIVINKWNNRVSEDYEGFDDCK